MVKRHCVFFSSFIIIASLCIEQAGAQQLIGVVSFSPPPNNGGASSTAFDLKKAKPFDLPIASKFAFNHADTLDPLLSMQADNQQIGIPGFALGGLGDSQKHQVSVGVSAAGQTGRGEATRLDFGTSNLPFTTSRADLIPNATNDQYPYRASGKLAFFENGGFYTCSASLIKRGIVVTAAHCVASFGKKTYYSAWTFIPGYRNGEAPFGIWTVAKAAVLTSYLDGSDICQQSGVVCKDDVAVLVLNPQKDSTGKLFYPGQNTGWFSFAWDRTVSPGSLKITHVTQIGYPACLDNANYMERNDAQGTVDFSHSSNLIIGSMMCGGSSGGPWIINFGVQPTLTGTAIGADASVNQVVGVTSWGSTENTVKWMGASPFLSTNIVPLVAAVCGSYPDACKE